LRKLSKALSFCSFVFCRHTASCSAYIVYWECRQKLPAPYRAHLVSRYCNLTTLKSFSIKAVKDWGFQLVLILRTLLIDSALLLVHKPDVFAFRFG
jgi:hypothetical protein